MILLVDFGNRRIKWIRDSDLGVRPAEVAGWRGRLWPELLEQQWGRLEPGRVLVSNVAGEAVERAVSDFCESHWQLRPEWLRSERSRGGLTSAYETPGSLGNDRWAAMIGALGMASGPFLVIDSGTAVTVDLVDADGRHQGGAIFPGLATMRDSLGRSTANLKSVDAEADAFTGSTPAAIAGGTIEALVGAIERYCALADACFDGRVQRFICGGDAPLVMRRSALEFSHVPDLVLSGLLRGLQ